MRAAIYCRVSTVEQAREGYSLAAQEGALRKFAESQGWDVSAVYVEEGRSGKDTNRPELQRMLADAAGAQFDVVLVWKLDRLTRSVVDCDRLLRQLDKAGVKFKSATEPFETTSAIGKLFVHLVSAMAQFEREQISERIGFAMRQRAETGAWGPGPRPFGYDVLAGRLAVNDQEAEVVREIYRRYCAGGGMREIVRDFNRRGVQAPKGRAWSQSSVHYLLRNPVYAGRVGYGNYIARVPAASGLTTYAGAHTAIVSDADWQAAQELRSRRRGMHPKAAAVSEYPLTGRLRCGLCDSPVHGKRVNGKRGYICSGRDRRASCTLPISYADEIEQAVVDQVRLRATRTEIEATARAVAADATVRSPGSSVKAKIARAQQRKERLIDALESGALAEAEVRERVSRLNDEIRDLQQQALEAPREPSIAEEELARLMADFPASWSIATPAERKSLVLLLTRRIVLWPGKRVAVEMEGD